MCNTLRAVDFHPLISYSILTRIRPRFTRLRQLEGIFSCPDCDNDRHDTWFHA